MTDGPPAASPGPRPEPTGNGRLATVARELAARVRRLVAQLVGRAAAASPSGRESAARVRRLETTLASLEDRVADLADEVDRWQGATAALVEAAVGTAGADGHILVALPTGGRTRTWLTFGGGREQYVVRHLARFGFADYEPATLATVLALLDEDGVLLDVGANIGLVAMVVAACRPDAEVLAFEPTPDLADRCRELLAANGLDVAVHQLALGAEDGTMSLYLSPTDTSNSLRRGFRDAVDEVPVDVRRLDTWMDEHGHRPPSVLKVDTESTEPDVLRGAGRTVAEHRPWIVVEVLHGRTEQDLQAFCAEHDYHPHHLRAGGPEPREQITGDDTYEELNWLLAPGPLPDGFAAAFATWHARLLAARTVDLRPVTDDG